MEIPGLEMLWAETLGDPGISIAVLDGPVDQSHPGLAGANLAQLDTLVSGEVDQGPASRHGTHIASVIFGQHDGPVRGIAPGCRGLVVPVFRDGPDGTIAPCSQLDLARAISQAVEGGAHIINISGGELSPSGTAHPILAEAVRSCAENGVLIVAAAGNEGCECLHVPGALPSVLAVGAMNAQGYPLEFSNWGEQYLMQGVLALGENISGAVPGGGTAVQSGTSYATPIVTGIAGLLLSLQAKFGVNIEPSGVRAAILESAYTCEPKVVLDCRPFIVGSLNVAEAHHIIMKHKGGDVRQNRETEVNPKPNPPSQTSKARAGDISNIKDSDIGIAGRDYHKTEVKPGATYIEKVEFTYPGRSEFSEILRKLDMQKARQDPSVLKSAIGYKTDFSEIAKQIREFKDLKDLHDALHDIETEYFQIRAAYEFLPGETRAWEWIARHKHFLSTKIQGLLDIAKDVSFSEDVMMTKQLEQITHEIELVFETDPRDNAKAAMGHLEASIHILYIVFTSHPRTIDTRLYDIVRSLRLDKVVDGMENILNLSSAKDNKPVAGAYFQQFLSEIKQLAQELKELSEIHNILQSIAHELYRIEANLTLKELNLSWRYLEGMNKSLESYKSIEWLDSLRKKKDRLTQSLASNLKVKDNFYDYLSFITIHFHNIDKELKSLTKDLESIGKALDVLLEFLEDLS